MSSITRSIHRRIVRKDMEKAGHKKVAKRIYNPMTKTTYSYFQDNWKKWS